MPKVLTKLRIDEISAVDRGAGEGVKILLMKRDDDFEAWRLEQEQIAEEQNEEHLKHHGLATTGKYLKYFERHDDDADESVAATTPDTAIHLNKETPMTKTEIETKLAENLRKMGDGAIEIAKAIVAKEANVVNLSEEEFTAVITAHARKMYPGDRADAAFAKVFSSDETIRRAHAIVKALPPVLDFQPMVVSGATTFEDALADRSEAYDAIVALAAKMRQRLPEMTEAAAFAATIQDPTNRELATRALQRPVPPGVGGYLFPRESSPGRQ
jgi:hypothetical protein